MDLVTFTEEILNGKFLFLCCVVHAAQVCAAVIFKTFVTGNKMNVFPFYSFVGIIHLSVLDVLVMRSGKEEKQFDMFKSCFVLDQHQR